MKRIRQVSLLLAAAALLTCGCSRFSTKPLSFTGMAFDTVIAVQIYDSVDEEVLEHCQTMCSEYEQKFSATIETSEISQINSAGGAPVAVSEDTIELIKKGIYYSELSNGAFDITVGSVSSLWDFKSEDPVIPSPEAITEAKKHVNYNKIVISNNTVTLTDPQSKIDLGAIAKGYIADRLKDYLKSQDVKHAIINLGGNVLAIGGKPDGSPFNIGIRKPFHEEEEPLTTVKIKNKSVVTSGTSQRYFEKDGNLYHHIIDPASGYPCNNGLNSVTIITNSSLTADALSTTCFLLGPDKGLRLVNQLDNVDAVFVDTNNNITYSRNFLKK